MSAKILAEIKNELDESWRGDANLQHLIHYTEGYRAYILDVCNPYAYGSARYTSFERGYDQARADRKLAMSWERDD